jgi:hypothetical protein
MSKVISRSAGAAFAGLLIWSGGLNAPASAAGLSEIDACPIVSPRFEPIAPRRAPLEAIKFAGGARLRFLVATPCPHAIPPFDA